MSAIAFVRESLFNPRSPACLWKHPVMAFKVMAGALENFLLPFGEKTARGAFRECPVCDWRGHRFRNFLSADEVIRHCICTGCGSFDRPRQLVVGVREELADNPGSAPKVMIGYSLSTAMRFLLEHEGLARCFRSDIDAADKRFSPDLVMDLRTSSLIDGGVDWVFCSHVLEHIPELEMCVDEILRILNPIEHAREDRDVWRYTVEPYVVAADVYRLPGRIGQGGWSWYTGSAAWMYRVWIEEVLGLKKRADQLIIDPVIPDWWDGFKIHLRHGEAIYVIEVQNPDHIQQGVAWLELDGQRLEERFIRLDPEPVKHTVLVRMGNS